jgi:hypothetical protein
MFEEDSELTMRQDLALRMEDASIDRAHYGDEFFRLDSLGIFCKSDIVEFARLPSRKRTTRTSKFLASPVQPLG